MYLRPPPSSRRVIFVCYSTSIFPDFVFIFTFRHSSTHPRSPLPAFWETRTIHKEGRNMSVVKRGRKQMHGIVPVAKRERVELISGQSVKYTRRNEACQRGNYATETKVIRNRLIHFDSDEKTITTLGERWWPPAANQGGDEICKTRFVVCGRRVMSSKTFEVSSKAYERCSVCKVVVINDPTAKARNR